MTVQDKFETQRDEFEAADSFSRRLRQLNSTPIVDEDYPEIRHLYESALENLIRKMTVNGRFGPNNRYGVVPV